MAKTTATATTRPVHRDRDLEIGASTTHTDIDINTSPSGSSSFTPNDTPLKAATPRRSLEFVDHAPQRRSFATKALRKIESSLPAPLTRWSRKAGAWIQGPEAAAPHRIAPLFERVQTLPTRLIARLPKTARSCLFAGAFVLWVVLFGVLISDFSLPSSIAEFGAPVRLSCAAQLWWVALIKSGGLDDADCKQAECAELWG